MSDATYYNWKAKYGGMEASDIKRLKDLEDENRRLKQMYADLSLEHTILKDIVEKSCKACCAARAGGLCRAVGISDSVYRYRPDTRKDEPVIRALQQAVERYPAYGFSKLFKILRRWGHQWNHKRVYRLYCDLNLNKRRRGKKRLPTRNPEPLAAPATLNQSWSIDFMSDNLFCGRRFRTFNVVDDFNREAQAIEIDLSLPSLRVIRVLVRIVA